MDVNQFSLCSPRSSDSSSPAVPPGPVKWLDVQVLYARVTSPSVSREHSPDRLLFTCWPREVGAEMEVNGARIPPSEQTALTLRRDRVDEEASEATFVSTDKLRISVGLPFSISHQEDLLVDGVVWCRTGTPLASQGGGGGGGGGVGSGISSSGGGSGVDCIGFVLKGLYLGGPGSDVAGGVVGGGGGGGGGLGEWCVQCVSAANSSWGGFGIKSVQDYTTGQPVQPSLEVCIVGKCAGVPVVLSSSVQLAGRRKQSWKGDLHAIPEMEEDASSAEAQWNQRTEEEGGAQLSRYSQGGEMKKDIVRRQERQEYDEYRGPLSSFVGLYETNEDGGAISWFNAGVRVGVGLGLGMCIGVGLGVGLIVRTYQTTTRSFRRGFG